MSPLKKCVISPKMTKIEGLNTENFVKTIRVCRPTGRAYEGGPHRIGVHICTT
jgi:hypothetical protein